MLRYKSIKIFKDNFALHHKQVQNILHRFLRIQNKTAEIWHLTFSNLPFSSLFCILKDHIFLIFSLVEKHCCLQCTLYINLYPFINCTYCYWLYCKGRTRTNDHVYCLNVNFKYFFWVAQVLSVHLTFTCIIISILLNMFYHWNKFNVIFQFISIVWLNVYRSTFCVCISVDVYFPQTVILISRNCSFHLIVRKSLLTS